MWHNRPDIVCIDCVMNHCFLIDIAIPGDSRVLQKISEKQQCYSDLKIEVQKKWSYRASVAPVIIGSLGSIPRGLKDQLKTL